MADAGTTAWKPAVPGAASVPEKEQAVSSASLSDSVAVIGSVFGLLTLTSPETRNPDLVCAPCVTVTP